jgi:pyruvate dehydrogenase E2 component (dihydrolipoamide acetyltransferase)
MCCGGGPRPTENPAYTDAQRECPDGRPVRATPDARHLASQRGVDLCGLSGTGRDGLVRREDVEAAS